MGCTFGGVISLPSPRREIPRCLCNPQRPVAIIHVMFASLPCTTDNSKFNRPPRLQNLFVSACLHRFINDPQTRFCTQTLPQSTSSGHSTAYVTSCALSRPESRKQDSISHPRVRAGKPRTRKVNSYLHQSLSNRSRVGHRTRNVFDESAVSKTFSHLPLERQR